MTYRSKRREQIRLIHPGELPAGRQGKTPPGLIGFDQKGPPYSQLMELGRANNRRQVNRYFADRSTALLRATDCLHYRATEHLPLMYSFGDVQVREVLDVLVPCFERSLMSLYLAQTLTTSGLYSGAYTHLRHAFEALIIAKFCSLNPSADIYDRWVDGVELYFSNSVLKKISNPPLPEIKNLWKLLCEKSHATIASGQADLRWETTRQAVALNFSLIGILVHWMTHLYAGHIVTPSAAYYGRRYRRSAQVSAARKDLQEFLRWQRQFLSPRSIALIREYT